MAKKLSTADILKMARQQNSAGAAAGDKPADETPAAVAPAAAADEASAQEPASAEPAKPKAAPKGTSSILAAIRGQGAGGEPAGTPAAAAKPAASGGPKSTADILAMARGKAAAAPADGGATKAAPAKKPAASGAAGPTGALPPVRDMLEAMRRPAGATSAVGVTAVAEAPAKPAKPELRIPKKPEAKAKKETRRGFLKALVTDPLVMSWSLFTVTCAGWLLATARFMFPNVLVEPPTQFKIGPPSDYPLGTVSTKWTAARGIWVVHTDQYKGKNSIYALASVCTHLGCTPGWLEGEQKFKCPCHGSGFYITGINFEGPAPRPLERVGLRVAADGTLQVDKSVKFQEEKGQWEDGNSYVDAALLG